MTPKQKRFVEEYLKDLNATQAYIRAGYSPNGADGHAARLVGNGRIKAAIAEAQDKRAERVEITQDMVINGLCKEATREGEGTSQSARVQAWAHLGKHLGMFVDRHEDVTPRNRASEEREFFELLGRLGFAHRESDAPRAAQGNGQAKPH